MAIQIAIFVVAVGVMVGWSFLHMRNQAGDADEPGSEPDFPTILAATRAANPGLSFEPGSDRSPEYFRVKEMATGREAKVPSEELQGARIRFVACDLASIPPALLYPNRSEITCLELRNDKHALQAYYFATPDALGPQVTFFELNVTPQYRLGAPTGRSRAVVKRNWRKEFTHEFIVTFMLGGSGGFVGYKEDKSSAASH